MGEARAVEMVGDQVAGWGAAMVGVLVEGRAVASVADWEVGTAEAVGAVKAGEMAVGWEAAMVGAQEAGLAVAMAAAQEAGLAAGPVSTHTAGPDQRWGVSTAAAASNLLLVSAMLQAALLPGHPIMPGPLLLCRAPCSTQPSAS